MHGGPLPDSMADWPRNPYELLRVTRGMDAAEIRRAYVRLIRHYTPELAPDAFQRIREAYESLTSSNPLPPPREFTPPSPQLPGDAPTQRVDGSDPSASSLDLDARLNHLWEQACAGNLRSAYAGIRQLLSAAPGLDHIYLCLFWLLRCRPTLEPSRTPLSWLTQGMSSAVSRDRLLILYCSEIERDPAHVLDESSNHLIGELGDIDQALQIARCRWRACAWLERFDVVRCDLARLRGSLRDSVSEQWGLVLMAAIDSLMWAESSEFDDLVRNCVAEVGTFQELELRHPAEFDRLEFIYEMTRDWSETTKDLPPYMLQLVKAYCLNQPHACVPGTEIIMDKFVHHPAAAIAMLDSWLKRNPNLVIQLDNAVRGSDNRPAPEAGIPDEPWLKGRILESLLLNRDRSYDHLRLCLLGLCTYECVPPSYIARICHEERFRLEDGSQLGQLIAADLPLTLLYHVHEQAGVC